MIMSGLAMRDLEIKFPGEGEISGHYELVFCLQFTNSFIYFCSPFYQSPLSTLGHLQN